MIESSLLESNVPKLPSVIKTVNKTFLEGKKPESVFPSPPLPLVEMANFEKEYNGINTKKEDGNSKEYMIESSLLENIESFLNAISVTKAVPENSL